MEKESTGIPFSYHIKPKADPYFAELCAALMAVVQTTSPDLKPLCNFPGSWVEPLTVIQPKPNLQSRTQEGRLYPDVDSPTAELLLVSGQWQGVGLKYIHEFYMSAFQKGTRYL